MNRERSTEAVLAQIEVKHSKQTPGWMSRGYWICGQCGRVTLPIGENQNKCCHCGTVLVPRDYVKPLEF